MTRHGVEEGKLGPRRWVLRHILRRDLLCFVSCGRVLVSTGTATDVSMKK
jgi:hypothetical protein